jgi:transcriptional regulator with XRE-family HTH domain
LRIQRRLRQSDFGTVPTRTIARIERGESAKPQRRTLEAIAGSLGVQPEEITTY